MAKRQEIPDILGQERQKMTVMDDVLSGKPVVQVAISSIRIDGGTQMRAQLDDATVFEYTQAMAAADGWGTFPPVVAFYDGTDYWLGDGFHRAAAFRDAFTDSARKIPVDVRAGTRRDAILHAAGANANHGLRRAPADKRRAVETLLRDDEWAQWSNVEIGRRCNVSESFVRNVKREIGFDTSHETKYVHPKTGQVTVMHSANIGSNQPQRTNTFESSIPTISEAPGGRPAPTVMNGGRMVEGRQYQTIDQLIEEIRSCVPQFYTEPHEQQKMAIDIMACANARDGGFWKFVTTQTGNYLQSDLSQAMRIVSGEITERQRQAYMAENGRRNEEHFARLSEELAAAKNTPAGDWPHTRPAVVNLAPEDLAALGWTITVSHEDSVTKYRAQHTDPARHMWGYHTELTTMVTKIREMEARLATPAGTTTDDDEDEQPLQLAPVEDDEVSNILTPDRPKSAMAVHFSSESPEHYTPSVIIEAAIACMGGIDLDPCSNSKETPNVPAATHYTREDDGLTQEWRGCVYMNPPYGREIDEWIAKLVSEYEAGNVTEAIALVPSRTDTQWWQRLREYHVCLVSGRLKFIGNNDSAPFPSAVFYLGQNIGRFVYAFEELGDIWRRTVRGVDYGD